MYIQKLKRTDLFLRGGVIGLWERTLRNGVLERDLERERDREMEGERKLERESEPGTTWDRDDEPVRTSEREDDPV
jgi:hypothetical protein